MLDDPVRALLSARGVAPHVVAGGLDGLVLRWESVAAEVARGYEFSPEDWCNDLDARLLLHLAKEVAAATDWARIAERVDRADERLRQATLAKPECVYGAAAAAADGFTADEHWWYWRWPAAPDAGD